MSAAARILAIWPPRHTLEERFGVGLRGGYPRLWCMGAAQCAKAAAAPLFGPSAAGDSTHETEVRGKFSRGVAWNTTAKMATRAAQFLVTIVLARLLLPADFGLAEMAAMVTMMFGMVAEFGFAHALIQKAEVTTEDIRTAMTLSILFACVLASAGVAASGFVAGLFDAPSLQKPLAVACLGIVAAAVSVTPRALLMKRFDFRSIAIADFASSVLYGLTGIALAILGAGVWSLVLAVLVMIVSQAVILSVRSRCAFRPLIDIASAKELVPFGARMFGANFLDYLRGNLDYFVIGLTLGAAPLGIYTIAFRIADFPRSRLVTTISEVSFSAMSSVHREIEMLRRSYSRALAMAALFAFPLLLGFTTLAPEFVAAVYGQKWMGAVAPLRILLPMVLLLIISQQSTMVLVAMGEPGRYLKMAGAYTAGVGVLAAAGAPWGVSGVALGVLAATVAYAIVSAAVIYRRAGITPLLTLQAIAAPCVSCAVMVAALMAYRSVVPFARGAAGVLWLAGAGALGAVVYVTVALAAGTVMRWNAHPAGITFSAERDRVASQAD